MLKTILCSMLVMGSYASLNAEDVEWEFIATHPELIAEYNDTIYVSIKITKTPKTNAEPWLAVMKQLIESGNVQDSDAFLEECAKLMHAIKALNSCTRESRIVIDDSSAPAHQID